MLKQGRPGFGLLETKYREFFTPGEQREYDHHKDDQSWHEVIHQNHNGCKDKFNDYESLPEYSYARMNPPSCISRFRQNPNLRFSSPSFHRGFNPSTVPQDHFDDALDEVRKGANEHENENIGHALPHVGQAGDEIETIAIELADLPKNERGDDDRDDETDGDIEGSPGRAKFCHAFPLTSQRKEIARVQEAEAQHKRPNSPSHPSDGPTITDWLRRAAQHHIFYIVGQLAGRNKVVNLVALVGQ